MKMKSLLYFVMVIALCFSSCTKDEGEGGKITLKGTVKQQNLDKNDSLVSEEYPVDENVFIIYGDGEIADNDTKTGIEGNFEFKFLYPGNYIVYVIGDDTTNTETSGKSIYKIDVELSKSDDIKDIGELVNINILDFDDGRASISGNVYKVNYFDGTTIIKDTTYAQDEEVYLIFDDNTAYDDRVRTSYDGSFTFSGLIKGSYTVYIYSDNLSPTATQKDAEKRTVNITTEFQSEDLGDIYIKNKL